LNTKFQKNIVKFLPIFLAILYMLEILLYFKNDNKLYSFYLPFYKLDEKTRLYLDKSKINTNFSLVYANKLFLNKREKNLFPLSGIPNIKTYFCKNRKIFSSYYSDRYGFNNPDYVWNGNYVDILLIGETISHGACENRPNDLASQLRLYNKKVISIGYNENESLMILGSLKEYFPKNTRKVIWIYNEGNDTDETEYELKDSILSNYFYNKKFTQNLKGRQKEIRDIIKKANFELYNSSVYNIKREIQKTFFGLIGFIKMSNLRYYITNLEMKKTEIVLPHPKFKEIIVMAKEYSLENNAKFYFIYVPEYKRFNSKVDNKEYEKIKKIMYENEIKFIDLNEEIFSKILDPKNLYLKNNDNKTLNKKAFKVIAKRISNLD
tara:strand:+ start:172 stop:1308 length:1137 start_codon:yes stop_codon:yes gene_type:complete